MGQENWRRVKEGLRERGLEKRKKCANIVHVIISQDNSKLHEPQTCKNTIFKTKMYRINMLTLKQGWVNTILN